MTTNQTAPVTDDELDQMIWKLERDGMTPKQLSLMRELREVRRAKVEPVAWMYDGEDGREYNGHNEFSGGGKGVPLYTAQPAPVVPSNYVTAEHRRIIEMLLNVCGAAFELADDSCQQDVDGEECNVVPSDAFKKLSDALDEIENTLPTEDIDRPDVFLAWSAMPRASLKSLLQAGNSPATQDGWKLVPEEPTHEMLEAGDAQFGTYDVYRRMIAAAPKEMG